MKKIGADAVAGVVSAVIGVFFLINTLNNSQLSFASTTSDGVPGAGFFPYILSVLLIVLGAALLIRGVTAKREPYVVMTPEISGNMKVMLLLLAGFLVFLIVWKISAGYFGNSAFLACVFLFEIYLNRLFERSWKFTLIYAVVFTLFIYLVFNTAFHIMFTA